jgi:septation ring formation regulator EzrA
MSSLAQPREPPKPLTPIQEQKLKDELVSFKQESMVLANILSLFHYFYSNIQKEKESLAKKLKSTTKKIEDTGKDIAELKKEEKADETKLADLAKKLESL